jgi:hypothetical protein
MHAKAKKLRGSNKEYRELTDALLADYATDTPTTTRIPMLGKRRPDGLATAPIDGDAVGIEGIEVRRARRCGPI